MHIQYTVRVDSVNSWVSFGDWAQMLISDAASSCWSQWRASDLYAIARLSGDLLSLPVYQTRLLVWGGGTNSWRGLPAWGASELACRCLLKLLESAEELIIHLFICLSILSSWLMTLCNKSHPTRILAHRLWPILSRVWSKTKLYTFRIILIYHHWGTKEAAEWRNRTSEPRHQTRCR